MTSPPVLLNLAAYSAQIACIVAVGGLASALLRIDVPSVRYAYWRVVLVISLVLPWLQGRTTPGSDATAVIGTVQVATGSAVTAAAASQSAIDSALPWTRVLLALVVAGAVLRLVWIAGGLLRLRRLRREGSILELTPIDEAFRRSLAPHASVREIGGLRPFENLVDVDGSQSVVLGDDG